MVVVLYVKTLHRLQSHEARYCCCCYCYCYCCCWCDARRGGGFSLLLPLFFPLSCKRTRYRDSSRDSFSTVVHVEPYDKNLVRWKMRYAVRSYSSTFEPYLLLKKSSLRACAFAILLRLIHSIHSIPCFGRAVLAFLKSDFKRTFLCAGGVESLSR
jgi:hypothetical protein